MFHPGFNFFNRRASCLPQKTFLLFHHPSHYRRSKVDLTVAGHPVNALYHHFIPKQLKETNNLFSILDC